MAGLKDIWGQATGAISNAAGTAATAADEYILEPVRKALGVYVPKDNPSELPDTYFDGATAREKAPFEGFRRSTQPQHLPQNLPLYRGDERRGGIETLPDPRYDALSPLRHDVAYWHGNSKTATPHIQQLYAFARLAGAARQLGLPTIEPDQFAAMALKEGHPSLGQAGFYSQAKPDQEFRTRLDQYNIPEWQKNFLQKVNYTHRVAERRNIPFDAVWNGTGTNYLGQTGNDYARAMQAHRQAVADPKNALFRSFVRQAFTDGARYGLPLVSEKARDTDIYLKSDPTYKYHTPDGRVKHASGGIVIDDGNPAKRRKLI